MAAAGLAFPLRSTAETATTSGDAPFQERDVLLAGRISVFHAPPVRVCKSHNQALSAPFDDQLILSSRAPSPLLEAVRVGFAGRALPSQGEAGTRAGCA